MFQVIQKTILEITQTSSKGKGDNPMTPIQLFLLDMQNYFHRREIKLAEETEYCINWQKRIDALLEEINA